jgi:two-component system, NarL family, response regulator DegU
MFVNNSLLKKAKSMPIRVLLTGRNKVFREGVRSVLQEEPDMDIIVGMIDPAPLVQTIEQLAPTVLVLEISHHMFNMVECIRNVAGEYDNIKMVVISIYPNRRVVESVLEAGARSYVLKHRVSEELAKAIRLAALNVTFISPEIDVRGKSDLRMVIRGSPVSC